ncbi:MAG: hypothetical protein QF819_11035 [Gemmatimonadota bacterium]|jgi:hypothetical protein|nr:hypothetical protein [Gemmatimonadota bacterium]MDP6460354.1 hypothetical protein [Gemmatimonadota bacterium]MDP6530083.1 hypothetical protein [Gemmatimonadota bacterium]MDP6803620.1 hypothetical protein [Gemmatimonadota bacterium]MDP6803684.1 hypothetical protein [Gemmatimonadota bacterium]
MTPTDPCTCLSCGTSETAIPLISIRFSGSPAWVCSQCMPVLIHRPEELVSKLGSVPAASDDC